MSFRLAPAGAFPEIACFLYRPQGCMGYELHILPTTVVQKQLVNGILIYFASFVNTQIYIAFQSLITTYYVNTLTKKCYRIRLQN
jgi:hypothetical protein